MPSQVPLFTMSNYVPLMDDEFTSQETVKWISIWEALAVLQAPLTKIYADLDARTLGTFLVDDSPTGSTYLDGKNIPTRDVLVAMKLLCPTLRCCDYFSWNVGHGNHTGIDIILPQNTPIISFTDGEVVRIKTRDGVSKNEGNCVAVKSTDGYVVGYEHLERIDVSIGQKVTQGDIIGLCGTTGNSTQYHLHLQVDKGFAPFHPYRSSDINDIQKYTIDPLPYLRAWSPVSLYRDIPKQNNYYDAIMTLTKGLIIKGFDRHIYPDNILQRYHAALIIDRALRLYSLYDGRKVITPVYISYSDNTLGDTELDEALVRLQKYGIMKGSGTKFEPTRDLKGEQLLALLGRIFYGLSDSQTVKWYDGYVEHFTSLGVIDSDREYITKSIPRKEVFLIMNDVLTREGVL